MSFRFSSLFTADVTMEAFDRETAAQAAAGRVPAAFAAALQASYGVSLGSSPKAAMATINGILSLSSPLKVARGHGARATAAAVAQALHAIGVLLSAGPAKVPAVLDLPEWADPDALAQKSAARAEKRAEKRAAASAAAEASEAVALAHASADKDALASAVALVCAAAGAGALTSAQREALANALAAVQFTAAPAPKRQRAAKRQRASA